jgi:hypothetical protein
MRLMMLFDRTLGTCGGCAGSSPAPCWLTDVAGSCAEELGAELLLLAPPAALPSLLPCRLMDLAGWGVLMAIRDEVLCSAAEQTVSYY